MCRNSVVEEKIVEKVSTFIKVDDSNFNSRRRQIDPRLKRNARIILESQPQITTEQDLANYLLRFVLEGNCSFYLLAIAKLLNDKYLKLFSFYFQTLIENHQLQLLNARHHLSAYLDEVCYWQALKISGTVPPSRTSQAAMVDTRGRMWIVGGETFTHSRHIDMVAQFSPDFSNPDVQGKYFIS